MEPQVLIESEIKLVGPGYDDDHYIRVPTGTFHHVENVGSIGIGKIGPGEETCVFALEAVFSGT